MLLALVKQVRQIYHMVPAWVVLHLRDFLSTVRILILVQLLVLLNQQLHTIHYIQFIIFGIIQITQVIIIVYLMQYQLLLQEHLLAEYQA